MKKHKSIKILQALFDGARIEDKDSIEYVFAVPTLADDNVKRFCMVAYKKATGGFYDTVFIESSLSINQFLDQPFKIQKSKQ
jgi:hypothetical protein